MKQNEALAGDVLLAGLLEDPEFDGEYAAVKWHMQLVKRLLGYREAAGLTQRNVADAMGTTQSAVSTFETASNDPRISTILRYANAVGVRLACEISRASTTSRGQKFTSPPTGGSISIPLVHSRTTVASRNVSTQPVGPKVAA